MAAIDIDREVAVTTRLKGQGSAARLVVHPLDCQQLHHFSLRSADCHSVEISELEIDNVHLHRSDARHRLNFAQGKLATVDADELKVADDLVFAFLERTDPD